MSDRPRRKHTAVLADTLGKGPLKLVDIGCGRGALARRLARDGHDVVAVDPQWETLCAARQDGHDGPGLLASNGEALPFVDTCFDVVLYFNALHHVPMEALDAAIAEARRVLLADGRLIVVEPIAEGAVFELMRGIENETEVRAAAEAALQHAAASAAWTRTQRAEYQAPVRHDSVEAFLESIVAVDPARAPAVRAQDKTLRAGFERLAYPANDAFWLDQPSQLTVLARRD